MNTHDKEHAGQHGGFAPKLPATAKRAYQTPRVIELGDVRELTRAGAGTQLDGRAHPSNVKP
jgi:hypothetical protein